MMYKYKLAALLVITFALQGCAAVAIGSAAAVATKTATDPRTVGTQVDDTALDSRTSKALKQDEEIKTQARIVTTGYKGGVLLTGQAPNQQIINRAMSIVQGVDGVEKVYNQIRLGTKVGAGRIVDDSWITAKIRSQLLTTKGISSNSIKVVTENGEVFLMGVVTSIEGRMAATVASRVAGTKLVITLFNYKD